MNSTVAMVDSPAALAAMVAQCARLESIALDTEFVWERTYYPRLGLVQVASADGSCWLVDAVALPDLCPLGALLAGDGLTKILHDAPQDLMILRRATGTAPRRIYDTRCAAALAGLRSTTSLAELVAATVGAHLAKSASRTNWLQRPLSAEQVQYAIEDVGYLHAVRARLERQVAARRRAAWLAEELAELSDLSANREREPRLQYRRIKGAGSLSRREAAVLCELAAWREEEARRCDRPRSRVVEDRVLLELARQQPRTPAALLGVRGVARRHVDQLLAAVSRGLEQAKAAAGLRERQRRPCRDERFDALVAAAMGRLRACAHAQKIDAPFIASRAEVRALVAAGAAADPAQHRLLRGWRRQLLGDQLLELIADRPASAR